MNMSLHADECAALPRQRSREQPRGRLRGQEPANLFQLRRSSPQASRGFRRVRQARDHSRGRVLPCSVRPIPKDDIQLDHHGTDPSLGVVVLSAAFPQGRRSGVCRFLPGRRRHLFHHTSSRGAIARASGLDVASGGFLSLEANEVRLKEALGLGAAPDDGGA